MKTIIAGTCLGLALAIGAMAAPAAAFEKVVNTPSGRAEMVFAYTGLNDALTAVQSECMDKGWMIISQSTSQVVCEVPMGIWQGALTQMLIGNQYSTTPKQFARFSLAQVGEHTRVQTQVWAETQMAFGQMQQHQFSDDGTYNNMLGFLAEAGAQFPVGTTFTAVAWLGVDGVDAAVPNGRRSTYAYRLTDTIEHAPGYVMGLRVGDLVTKINNRTFRDDAGMSAQLDRARMGQPLTVSVVRDGAELTLSGTAQGRPAINTFARPAEIPAEANGVTMQMGAAVWGDVATARSKIPGAPSLVMDAAAVEPAEEEQPAQETDLDRMRREAAEAQARLAEAEAAAAAAAPKR